MGEWKETNLGNICSNISYGYTASANLNAVGPKFLRITDIVPDRIDWQNVPYCEADAATIQKYKLKTGDILIARTGATTGYNKIIKNTPYDTIYASYLIRYQIDKTQAHPFYIGHILQSSFWYDYVDAIAGGSAQPGANAKQLATFEIILPPLPEQKAIASVLSSLDDKIDLLHRQNKTLEAMAETLFRQWFVEEARDDWEEGCLGDAIELFDHLRVPLSKTERDKRKTGKLYPYYGAAKIMDYINDYIFDGEYILLGEDGTVRTEEGFPILQYATGKFWVNNHTHVLKAKKPYNNFFIWNYLKKKNIDEIVTGAVQPKINQGNLKSLDLPKYPKELVANFNCQTEPLFGKINQNHTQIRTLEKLRDTLLPKLMSGEVRVEYEH
jgi:type I restriction enzyme, S subunit